jgi:hypothetical protein
VSLLLATAIWFLIRNYLDDLNKERQWDNNPRGAFDRQGGPFQPHRPTSDAVPPKAIPLEE